MFNQDLAEGIIEALHHAFPQPQQLDQLKASVQDFSSLSDDEWLTALDALQQDGRIEFRDLRTGFANSLAMAANIRLSSRERERKRHADRTRPLIFISCGQVSNDEIELGRAVEALVEQHGFVAYFAENQQSLEGVSEHILKKLGEAIGFIAILHPRGEVHNGRDGSTSIRGSVWIEQEIAIAAFIRRVLGREIEVKVFTASGIAREGIRDKLLLNPIPFSQDSDVLEELRSVLPEWLPNASKSVRKGRHLVPTIRAHPISIPGGAVNGERLFRVEAGISNEGTDDARDFLLQLFFPASLVDGSLPYNVRQVDAPQPGYMGLELGREGQHLYPGQQTGPLMSLNFVLRTPEQERAKLEAVVSSGNMQPGRQAIQIGMLIPGPSGN